MRTVPLTLLNPLLVILLLAACASPPPKPRDYRSPAETALMLRMQKEGVALVLDPCNVVDGIGGDDVRPELQVKEREAMLAVLRPRFAQLGIPVKQQRTPFYCASPSLLQANDGLQTSTARKSEPAPADDPETRKRPGSGGGMSRLEALSSSSDAETREKAEARERQSFRPLLGEPRAIRADPTLRSAWMALLRQLNQPYRCPFPARGCGESEAAATQIDAEAAARLKKELGVSLVWTMNGIVYIPSAGKNAAVKSSEIFVNVLAGIAAGLGGGGNGDWMDFSGEDTRLFSRAAVIDLDARQVLWVRPPERTVVEGKNPHFTDSWARFMTRMLLD